MLPSHDYSPHHQSQLTIPLCKNRCGGEHCSSTNYYGTVSSLGHEEVWGRSGSASFNQPSWSYWTWEPDLGNFRLCCMLWSREFIPLPPNWDPQGKSLNKTLFWGAHLITDTTGVQSPHCNLALVLHRGQKGTTSSLVSTSTSNFPCCSEGKHTRALSRNEKQQRHSRSSRWW